VEAGSLRPDGGVGCGDGTKGGDEACDGIDLGGATCASAVAAGWVGTLGCASDCTFDTTRCQTPPTTYNDIRNASFWSFVQPSTVGLNAGGGQFSGAFDGKYVYFAGNASVFRHDTSRPLADASAWSTFFTGSAAVTSSAFAGGGFDGRYVYFVPQYSSTILRYDTSADFGSVASWSLFDLRNVNPLASVSYGLVFDGRYLTVVPSSLPVEGGSNGIVLRFDTRRDFQSVSSWETFALTSKPGLPTELVGGAFDGQHVYLLPGAGRSSIIARYDSRLAFTTPAAWSSYDVRNVSASRLDFLGGVFDGRYVHLTPGYSSVLTRYDTTGALEDLNMWATFDAVTQTQIPGFASAAFDGRRVLLSPASSNIAGLIDTVQPLGTSGYFVSDDLTPWLGPADAGSVRGFGTAVFDGSHVYFFAGPSGVIARFDTKSPAWLPARWNASFL
jgi:hypothetical protein